LNLELLKERFEYVDGELLHKTSLGGAKKGQRVGKPDKDGYLITTVQRKAYRVHRIIFFMHHGYVPEMLDHIDNNPLNNRIENLRPATYSQNNLNRGKTKINKTGYKGVFWRPSEKKFIAKLGFNNKKIFLGSFDDPKLAHEAYCAAAKRYAPDFARTE
jgi:hypothetical protein